MWRSASGAQALCCAASRLNADLACCTALPSERRSAGLEDGIAKPMARHAKSGVEVADAAVGVQGRAMRETAGDTYMFVLCLAQLVLVMKSLGDGGVHLCEEQVDIFRWTGRSRILHP